MIPQHEFLSYRKGKHDDVMDSIWTALEGAKPCRKKSFDPEQKENDWFGKKVLDWMIQ